MKRVLFASLGLLSIPFILGLIKLCGMIIHLLWNTNTIDSNWLGFLFTIIGLIISLFIYMEKDNFKK